MLRLPATTRILIGMQFDLNAAANYRLFWTNKRISEQMTVRTHERG